MDGVDGSKRSLEEGQMENKKRQSLFGAWYKHKTSPGQVLSLIA